MAQMTPARDDPGPLLDPAGGPNDDPGDIWPTEEMIAEAEFWDRLTDEDEDSSER